MVRTWTAAAVVVALGYGHATVAAQETPRIDSTGPAECFHKPVLPEPIDARVLGTRPDDGGVVVIMLPKGVGPDVVHTDWTGVFTDGGKVLKDTDFKLVLAHGSQIWGAFIAAKLPSYTVRLFAPGYTH